MNAKSYVPSSGRMYFDAIASTWLFTSRAKSFSNCCRSMSFSAAIIRSKLSSGNLESIWPDVLRRDRVDVALHVACEELLELLPLDVVLGRDHPLEVVERELGVDRDDAVDLDRRIHALAAGEAVLELERGRRQPVAQQVLEQKLAEAAARLRRAENLLQL